MVPFSDDLSGFYTSPLGPLTAAVANALFWLFFVNFNLAIFNSLPIYPMDGGQAFESFLRGVGRGKISEMLARRVTTGMTFLLLLRALRRSSRGLTSAASRPVLTAWPIK